MNNSLGISVCECLSVFLCCFPASNFQLCSTSSWITEWTTRRERDTHTNSTHKYTSSASATPLAEMKAHFSPSPKTNFQALTLWMSDWKWSEKYRACTHFCLRAHQRKSDLNKPGHMSRLQKQRLTRSEKEKVRKRKWERNWRKRESEGIRWLMGQGQVKLSKVLFRGRKTHTQRHIETLALLECPVNCPGPGPGFSYLLSCHLCGGERKRERERDADERASSSWHPSLSSPSSLVSQVVNNTTRLT